MNGLSTDKLATLPNQQEWQELLLQFQSISQTFLGDLNDKQVANLAPVLTQEQLPESGAGLEHLFKKLKADLIPQMSASRGPRYWGFVTGGSTPVATFADWMVSLLDQNVAKGGDSIATQIERQAIQWLLELFDLPQTFTGIFTTGATASNFLASVTARQFAGQQQGLNVAKDGMLSLDVEIFSACPHASMVKTLGLAGFGQNNINWIETEPGSERLNTKDLERQLHQSKAKSKIVISSAATVTGTSFDDLEKVSELCQKHQAWLHVDAAFGIFERLLSSDTLTTRKLESTGLELADSITLDGHKWLNVPYDCGVFLTRHQKILYDTCHVPAPYLVNNGNEPDFMSLGIENSRRFRAFPAWMTLYTYGKQGIAWWVQKNRAQARKLADYIHQSNDWDLVHPCDLNVVLFRPSGSQKSVTGSEALHRINKSGKLFLSPGKWLGQDIIRAAICNWQTENSDINIAIQLLKDIIKTDE